MKKFLSLVALTLSISLLAGCGARKSTMTPTGQASAAASGGSFLNQPIPQDVLNTELFDSNGKTFSLSSLKGQTIVIANFLTSCQEICPMTSATMRQIGDSVAASALKDKVKVLEVSVDPGRDTVQRLSAYKELFGKNENWIVASGTAASVKKFWDYFGSSAIKKVFTADEVKALPLDWQTGKPNTYDVSHTDEVVIVDAKGNWAWLDLGNPNRGKAEVPQTLKKYLSEEGLNNLAKPQEPSWDSKAVFGALANLTGIQIKG